jgi:hypothetical protein
MEAFVPAQRGRDQIGLIQNSFQDLLQLMVDAIGRIQRDAAIDPDTRPPEAPPLFKYEEIPGQAQLIVEKVLQIDALLDEAVERTIIGKPEPEIFELLKAESDTFEANIEPLLERTQAAEVWIARSAEILDLLASTDLGIPAGEQGAEEDYDD